LSTSIRRLRPAASLFRDAPRLFRDSLSAKPRARSSPRVNPVIFDAKAINRAIITLKQNTYRLPTVGAAAPDIQAARGMRRAGA